MAMLGIAMPSALLKRPVETGCPLAAVGWPASCKRGSSKLPVAAFCCQMITTNGTSWEPGDHIQVRRRETAFEVADRRQNAADTLDRIQVGMIESVVARHG
jgi:hypothetical protein